MARGTQILAILLLALAFIHFACEGADAARVGRQLVQKTDPKEPNEPKDAKDAMDESGFFARLKVGGDKEAATGDDGDRRKAARKLAATTADVGRQLLQKTDPKEPKEPKDAKEAMDESGFFARLKADSGDEAATGDDGDRRKAHKLA